MTQIFRVRNDTVRGEVGTNGSGVDGKGGGMKALRI